MAVPIVIQGTTINIPSSGSSPDWSPAIIAAFQAIANALSGVVGSFDITPQTYSMVANSNSGIIIPNFLFADADVRGATVSYYIYRTTSSANEGEYGTMQLIYNINNTAGSLWEVARTSVGTSTVTFSMSDTGQMSFSSGTLAGTNHVGIIGFSAKALQQTY